MSEGSLRYRELREIARSEVTIVYPKDPKWTIAVSPLERVRFEENRKVGSAVVDVLRTIVDCAVPFESINSMIEGSVANMSPVQREKIRTIVENAKNRFRGYMRDMNYHLDPSRHLQLFYQAYNVTTNEVSERDIELTSYGTVVVTVRDSEVWKKIGGKENQRGFVRFSSIRLSGSYDVRMADKQSQRTVFVREREGDSEDEVKAVRRHEIAHDMYNFSFRREEDARYTDNAMRRYFMSMKDEIIAYLLEEVWQPSVSAYVSSDVKIACGDGSLSKYVFHEVMGSILGDAVDSERKIRLLAHYASVNLLDTERVAAVADLVHVEGCDVGLSKDAAVRAAAFARDFALIPREIGRLQLLRSREFDEALGGCITAQSLKEILYNLSRVQANDVPDARTYAHENISTVKLALHTALLFRIPFKHADVLMDLVREKMSSACDEKEKKMFEEVLGMWERNKVRWNAGGGGERS